MKQKINNDPEISRMELSFFCKEGGAYAKNYYLSIQALFPFSFAINSMYPNEPGVGQLASMITITYGGANPAFGAGPHDIFLGNYAIPPNPGVGASISCPPNGFVNKVLEIAEVKQGTTTRPPDKPYDNAQHKG